MCLYSDLHIIIYANLSMYVLTKAFIVLSIFMNQQHVLLIQQFFYKKKKKMAWVIRYWYKIQ